MVRQASSNLREHWNNVLNLNSQVNAEEKWTRIPKQFQLRQPKNSEVGQFLCFCCGIRTWNYYIVLHVLTNSYYLLLCFQMVLQMTVQKTVSVRERVRRMKKGLKPVAMPKIDRKNEAFSPKLPQISCERGYSNIYLWVYRISFQGEVAVILLIIWSLYCKLPSFQVHVNDLGHIPNAFCEWNLIWIWDNFSSLRKKLTRNFFFFSQLLTHKILFNFEISN